MVDYWLISYWLTNSVIPTMALSHQPLRFRPSYPSPASPHPRSPTNFRYPIRESTPILCRSKPAFSTLTVTAAKNKSPPIEGASDELNSIASENLDDALARRRVRSAFVEAQQRLDHCLFKVCSVAFCWFFLLTVRWALGSLAMRVSFAFPLLIFGFFFVFLNLCCG